MNPADRQNQSIVSSLGVSHALPVLLTEDELISLLRIPEISSAQDHHNVVENLKRMHGLPCIHISKTPLYPYEAIRRWIDEKAQKESRR